MKYLRIAPALLALGATWAQSPPPASGTQAMYAAHADSFERKLRHVQENGRRARPDQTPTVFTEGEVNAYFAMGRVKLPTGVKSVRFEAAPEVITSTARVDFDEITASRRSSNPLLSLFSGRHDVRTVARARGSGGQAQVHVESVYIDDVKVPRMALEFFVDHYISPKYPNVGLDTRFTMPEKVDLAIVGQHQLTATQK